MQRGIKRNLRGGCWCSQGPRKVPSSRSGHELLDTQAWVHRPQTTGVKCLTHGETSTGFPEPRERCQGRTHNRCRAIIHGRFGEWGVKEGGEKGHGPRGMWSPRVQVTPGSWGCQLMDRLSRRTAPQTRFQHDGAWEAGRKAAKKLVDGQRTFG